MTSAKVFVSLALAVSIAASPLAVSAQTCSYANEESLAIALTKPPGADLIATPFHAMVKAGPAAPEHIVLVDTGSPAVILPFEFIDKNAPGYRVLATDAHYGYVSSGNTYKGNWVMVPMTIKLAQPYRGSDTFTTEPMPVYGITATCKGETCTPLDVKGEGGKIGMMGISYKPHASLPDGVPPTTNLFFNLQRGNPGYILTANSIHVGLNKTNTADFRTLPLAGSEANPAPGVCIKYAKVDGQEFQTCSASLLVDTGINHFYLTMPPGFCPRKDDNTVSLFTGKDDPVLAFDFTWSGIETPPKQSKSSSPMAPNGGDCVTGASVALPEGTTFHVNTGRMVIAGKDYMYDHSCKAVGFRPTTAK